MDANGQSTAIRANMLTPVKFLLASGAAAALNFCARVVFIMFVPYSVAIVLAFGLGMAAAFVLNRQFVFSGSRNRLHQQALWFVAVNMLALAQTLLVSLLLARIVLPKLGMTWHSEEIAHAIGIAVPIFTSYIGHQRLTFR
jgi:putative flippase GtrA